MGVPRTSAIPPTSPSRRTHLIDRLEHDQRLDPSGRRLGDVGRRLDTSAAGSTLRGDPLGHALHPALTDLPIGCWTSSMLLDLVGGRAGRPAAQRLIALGIASVAPTVATGLVDLSRRGEGPRRVGVVHASANALATVLYALSWRDRRRGRHARGVALSAAGATVATIGGLLGGHLAFGSSASANATANDGAAPTADLTTTLPVG